MKSNEYVRLIKLMQERRKTEDDVLDKEKLKDTIEDFRADESDREFEQDNQS